MLPNIIIFRIPDVDGGKTFVEIPMDEDGLIDPAAGISFQVLDGDSYNNLGFDELVFAHNPGTNMDIGGNNMPGSYELLRIPLFETISQTPVVIHSDMGNLALACIGLMKEYKEMIADDSDADGTDDADVAQP